MKTITVTGSTRGIGYGLADSFLTLGCQVTVSGRTRAAVDEAVAALSSKHGADNVLGQACDVRQREQVQALWDATVDRFAKVDIWINNAGIGQDQAQFWEMSTEQIQSVVETNVIGAMHGATVAIGGMLEQGYGSLYNMEGLGSNGRRVAGLTLYGTTKAGLRYLTDALVDETKNTPVRVGALQPGMVVTDFLLCREYECPEDWERAKRAFNILADRVETVTPWLAQRVLASDRHGARINWLTGWKVMGRFLMAPFSKRDLFA